MLSHPTLFFDNGEDLIVMVMAHCKDHFFKENQHFGAFSMALMHLHASLLHVRITYFIFGLLRLDVLVFPFLSLHYRKFISRSDYSSNIYLLLLSTT